jgi:hypothetical protein
MGTRAPMVYTGSIGNYRWLNAWAEREQRRFDEHQSNPRLPGTEPTALRILQTSLSTLAMAMKGFTLPFLLAGAIAFIARHTVQSVALGVALVMVAGLSSFTTGVLIHARRASGRNWFTGLAPRVRSN